MATLHNRLGYIMAHCARTYSLGMQNYDEDKFKEVTKACALDKVHVLHAVGFQKKLFFSICFEYHIFSILLNFFVWLVHFRRSQARFHQKFVDFEVAMA